MAGVELPNELFHYLSNYLNGDEDRISLMLAGSWEEFTEFYVQVKMLLHIL